MSNIQGPCLEHCYNNSMLMIGIVIGFITKTIIDKYLMKKITYKK